MDRTIGINKMAVAAATIANWALSVAWYATFGTTWAQLTGAPPAWEFVLDKVIIGLGFNFLMALGVAVVLRAAGQYGAAQGAMWGLLLTALFVLPAHSGKWTWQDRPLLLAIDTGAHLLSLVASGVIIGAWTAKSGPLPSRKA
jgi:hypothetical protein